MTSGAEADLIKIGITGFVAITYRLFIQTTQQLKKTIADVIPWVDYFAKAEETLTDAEREQKARETLGRYAGQMTGIVKMIPNYWLWRHVARLPSRQAIAAASEALVLMSHSVRRDDRGRFDEAQKQFIQALRLNDRPTEMQSLSISPRH